MKYKEYSSLQESLAKMANYLDDKRELIINSPLWASLDTRMVETSILQLDYLTNLMPKIFENLHTERNLQRDTKLKNGVPFEKGNYFSCFAKDCNASFSTENEVIEHGMQCKHHVEDVCVVWTKNGNILQTTRTIMGCPTKQGQQLMKLE